MIFFYLNEKSKLPYEKYKLLCAYANVPEDKKIRLVEINNKTVRIILPPLSESLAEFIGALAGDGHMNVLTNEVSISMHKDLDENYSLYLVNLYQKLFNIKARRYFQSRYNKVKCYVYSKELVEFLSSDYSIPTGKKKGRLHIPHKIKKKRALLRAYLRGLYDTDGTFHRHHANDAAVGIISRDKNHIIEIKIAFERVGFSPFCKRKKSLFISECGDWQIFP